MECTLSAIASDEQNTETPMDQHTGCVSFDFRNSFLYADEHIVQL